MRCTDWPLHRTGTQSQAAERVEVEIQSAQEITLAIHPPSLRPH